MKIFSSTQIKKWDEYTIANEPISSIDLMERAATACYQWIIDNHFSKKTFRIFCGNGNNGGDGLAISRLLIENNCKVFTYIFKQTDSSSNDYITNLERLKTLTREINIIREQQDFPIINKDEIIIDALFGTGLNKPLNGINADLVEHINKSNATVISIDIPSGLFADKSSKGNTIIKANTTLTFQQAKLAFLMAENESYFGAVHILEIGLHKKFITDEETVNVLTDNELTKSIYKPRNNFSHKGDFGHAAIIAGSYGMMGASVLAAKACLRSGVGKLTCFIPEAGYEVMQISTPEAMSKVCGKKKLIKIKNELKNFNAIGIGPGIGIFLSHASLLDHLFKKHERPFVIDADALNTISENKKLLSLIPSESILTPHPKEFEKLFGKTGNDFERMELALNKSKEYNIYIILKGHHTLICTPDKKAYFNSTGNAGMATGGSGDVLTGIITGLLAQKYSSFEACTLGVYLHGLAGDIAAENLSEEAMIAGDIINNISNAFKKIRE